MTGVTEGFLEIGGRRTWHRIYGTATDKAPLLMLHGGPGAASADDPPFVETLVRERQVIQYDQIDTGRSQRVGDASEYSVERHLREVQDVRDALGLDDVHIWGQSWGGMLAMSYALTKPKGLRSLIVASGPHAIGNWLAAADEYRARLPKSNLAAMERCERTLIAKGAAEPKPGDGPTTAQLAKQGRAMAKNFPLGLSAPVQAVARAMSYVPPLRAGAYQLVGLPFIGRHVYRARPVHPGAMAGIAGSNAAVYNHMWGPSESVATGVLKDFDLTDRLHEIDVPMLVTSGGHECVRRQDVEQMLSCVSRAQWELFEDSAHVSEFEEPERYTAALTAFLAKVEAA